jgi:hypothetical protein
MKQPFDLIDRLQVRVAMFAIGRSTLRSQGAPGMVAHARKFLRSVDLRIFSVTTIEQFGSVLEAQTKLLADGFPSGGKGNWGAARKSLNIFLRDVLYCRPLCEHFNLRTSSGGLRCRLTAMCIRACLATQTTRIQYRHGPG